MGDMFNLVSSILTELNFADYLTRHDDIDYYTYLLNIETLCNKLHIPLKSLKWRINTFNYVYLESVHSTSHQLMRNLVKYNVFNPRAIDIHTLLTHDQRLILKVTRCDGNCYHTDDAQCHTDYRCCLLWHKRPFDYNYMIPTLFMLDVPLLHHNQVAILINDIKTVVHNSLPTLRSLLETLNHHM